MYKSLVSERNKIWNELYSNNNNHKLPLEDNLNLSLTITLIDGTKIQGIKGESTPRNIVMVLSNNIFVAEVNNKLWSLDEPLVEDSTIIYHSFDSDIGKKVFWNTSSFILASVLEELFEYPVLFYVTSTGFYCNTDYNHISEVSYTNIKTNFNKRIKSKYPIQKLTLSKDNTMKLFKNHKYISDIITASSNTLFTTYRYKSYIGISKLPLCNINIIKFIEIIGSDNIQNSFRLSCISFPDKKMLIDWRKQYEESKCRDYRYIGKVQQLFLEDSNQLCLLSAGTIIYNKLIDLIRKSYLKHNFEEVITSNMSSCDSHSKILSYKSLPLRLCEFKWLNFDNISKLYHDSHVFCHLNEFYVELENLLLLLKLIYSTCNLSFTLELSKCSNSNLDSLVKDVLNNSNYNYRYKDNESLDNLKIDIYINNCLNQSYKLGNISIDYNVDKQLVTIHTISYGCMEKFLNIIIEHFGGDWPLWLSPYQFIIVPVSDKFNHYANDVKQELLTSGLYAHVDLSSNTFLKKLAIAVNSYYNYILIVGNTEFESRCVSVRTKTEFIGTYSIKKLIDKSFNNNL